jgi:UPF0755 protein
MKRGRKRKFIVFFLVLLAISILFGRLAFQALFGAFVHLENDSQVFYIHSGWDENDVVASLLDSNYISKGELLEWVIEKKNYKGGNVVSGKYTIKNGMSANELVDFLRAGNGEEEVRVSFNAARTIEELAGKVAVYIEADSTSLVSEFSNPDVFGKYGFNDATFKSMFLPDTYLMEWDTDADEFVQRMATEYKAFWNADRLAKAQSLGLSQSEVTTLASIVQAEQQAIPSERPTIAGLYINRLKRGMRLQSDPTVIYAIGDFNINRVLKKHLTFDSPFNTYVYAGLPPGPINIPDKQSIDAVLNADDHNYIYMCAKADFSGYHAFASSLSAHNINAREFQAALNERKIYN